MPVSNICPFRTTEAKATIPPNCLTGMIWTSLISIFITLPSSVYFQQEAKEIGQRMQSVSSLLRLDFRIGIFLQNWLKRIVHDPVPCVENRLTVEISGILR